MATAAHPYEFKLIKAKEINVDKLYQRKKQNKMVKEIVQNFDYHKVNCVKVIYREGLYFAFDGQQTTTGLRSKFGDNYLVPCLVYYDVPTWVDEAILFEGTNSKIARKAVGTRDLWFSRLNRGEKNAMDIQRIVERHNMVLFIKPNSGGKDGRVQALDAVERTYVKIGREKFDELFDVLDKVWHGTPKSIEAPMISGLGCFIDTFYGKYDKSRLIKRLSEPTSLGAIISGGSSGSRKGQRKYAEEIANIYNGNYSEDSPKYLNIKEI